MDKERIKEMEGKKENKRKRMKMFAYENKMLTYGCVDCKTTTEIQEREILFLALNINLGQFHWFQSSYNALFFPK